MRKISINLLFFILGGFVSGILFTLYPIEKECKSDQIEIKYITNEMESSILELEVAFADPSNFEKYPKEDLSERIQIYEGI